MEDFIAKSHGRLGVRRGSIRCNKGTEKHEHGPFYQIVHKFIKSMKAFLMPYLA